MPKSASFSQPIEFILISARVKVGSTVYKKGERMGMNVFECNVIKAMWNKGLFLIVEAI